MRLRHILFDVMSDNARLARLILDQVRRDENHDDWDGRNLEIAELLEEAVATGPSRIDLRKQLFIGARDTNIVTYKELAEAIGESLADRIRDLDHDIGKLENDMLPSRLAMGTTIGLMLGAFAAVIYGSADVLTAIGISGAMVTSFFALQAYRKRAFAIISAMKARRANYDSFRNLLRSDP